MDASCNGAHDLVDGNARHARGARGLPVPQTQSRSDKNPYSRIGHDFNGVKMEWRRGYGGNDCDGQSVMFA
jgi:hypothetical protein